MEIKEVVDYKPLVEECFTSDNGYLANHYASEKGLEACINITVSEISHLPIYSLYKILHNDEIVGMFGIENNTVLNPFFIKPEFRKKQYVGPILNLMQSKMKHTYYMGLYDKNTPIMKFFLQNGGTIDFSGTYNGQVVHIMKFENGKM
jgi:hypothetical protein